MRDIPALSRSFFGATVLSAALAAALLGAPQPADAADKVGVQLDYVVRGNHAMFFVAKEKGYFAKQGIDVTDIRKGTGSPNAMRLVGNGNAEFGFGDLPTLAVARSQNVPVVALAAVNQRSPLAMISIAKSHQLKKAQDIKGLNFGIHPAGSTYIFFRAFLDANGMTEDDVKKSTVSPPFENYLLLGRVDVVAGYVDAEVPELEAKAGGPGSLSILLGADFGYGVYGSGLFTSEKMIAERPALVQRFVTAYLQAFRDVVEKPEEAADIIVRANPEYASKKDVLVKQLQADIHSTFFSAETKTHGIGSMTKAGWEATTKTLLDQGAMKQPIDVAAAFTDRFVTGAQPLKR